MRHPSPATLRRVALLPIEELRLLSAGFAECESVGPVSTAINDEINRRQEGAK